MSSSHKIAITWPNSPDINPVENLWSIMDEVVYKDPTPKTMKDLNRRLKLAWKKIPLSTLHDLSHSVSQRATASKRYNKQRRACLILTFWIYVLSKAIDVFKKISCRSVVSIKSYVARNKRNGLLGHPVVIYKYHYIYTCDHPLILEW